MELFVLHDDVNWLNDYHNYPYIHVRFACCLSLICFYKKNIHLKNGN